jgi:hypothetical protein
VTGEFARRDYDSEVVRRIAREDGCVNMPSARLIEAIKYEQARNPFPLDTAQVLDRLFPVVGSGIGTRLRQFFVNELGQAGRERIVKRRR